MKIHLTIKNLLIAVLAIVILYLLTCNKKVAVVTPIVKPISEQREAVRIDSIASQKFKDSVVNIINFWKHDAKKWQGNWNKEAEENAELQKGIGDLLLAQVPDTCKEYQAKVLAEYNRLVALNKKKDNSCNNLVRAKENIISQQNKLIQNGKEDYRKLRVNLDTCFAQQKKLEDYNKKILPRSSIYIGATVIGQPAKIYEGIGINLGFENKRGAKYEIGVLQMGAIYHYTVGYKKTLFKLK